MHDLVQECPKVHGLVKEIKGRARSRSVAASPVLMARTIRSMEAGGTESPSGERETKRKGLR